MRYLKHTYRKITHYLFEIQILTEGPVRYLTTLKYVGMENITFRVKLLFQVGCFSMSN